MAKEAVTLEGGLNAEALRRIKQAFDLVPERLEAAVEVGAKELIHLLQKRIFEDGKDSSGATIGTYSINTVIIKKDKMSKGFIEIPTNRKAVGSPFRSQTVRREGIELIKAANPAGKYTNRVAGGDGKVRLVNTGKLKKSMTPEPPESTATDVSVRVTFKRQSSKKINDIVKRYGPRVFDLSRTERDKVQKKLLESVGKAVKELEKDIKKASKK